jgi:preprotein translocase subunit SecG
MRGLLIALHIIVSGILIAMVLLQKGKGADIGAAFGGASQTVFGPRGAQSFMAKLTTTAAVIFMLTSFGLALTSARARSIMEDVKQPAPVGEQVPAPAGEPLAPVPAAPAPK